MGDWLDGTAPVSGTCCLPSTASLVIAGGARGRGPGSLESQVQSPRRRRQRYTRRYAVRNPLELLTGSAGSKA